VTALPEVGGYVDPNIEAIVALRLTLIVGAQGPLGADFLRPLTERGTKVYFPRTESIDEIAQMIVGVGERTQRAPEAADIVAKLRADIDALRARYANRSEPRVLLLYGVEPVVAAGPRSFADELLRLAHARNAVTDGGAYPTLDAEKVIGLDPDLILNASYGEPSAETLITRAHPIWGKLRAVRNGRALRVSSDTVLRPGPRIAAGLATLAAAIHDADGGA
jgi:iron complex transport system substrate-binding protein